MDGNTESKITENTFLVKKVFTFQKCLSCTSGSENMYIYIYIYIILLETKVSTAAARVKV